MITCADVQKALSARLDGEDPGLDDDVIDAHLSACEVCRDFFETAALLNRQLKFSPTDMVNAGNAPDLSASILEGLEPVRRRRATNQALTLALSRVALVVAGLFWVLWAVLILNGLVGITPADRMADLVVEAAAIRLALAFGMFFAAWKPVFATGMLPVYGALWTFRFGFATRALVMGTLSPSDTLGLVLLLVSVIVLLIVWLAGYGLHAMNSAWRGMTARPQSLL